MIALRIAFVIAAIIVCLTYQFSLPASFLIIGFAITLANSGLHGKSSETIDMIGGGLTWIGIAIFLYSVFVK